MLVFAVIVTILLSIFVSLQKVSKKDKALDTQDFFLASRNLSGTDFINTTVSYGYQIAALSLFASWGYLYGFWTIWVPIFWGLGFFILRKLNDKGLLNYFFNKINGNTIHGLIGKNFHYSFLAKLAAFASVIGLSGTAFFEAEFTSRTIASSLDSGNQNLIFVTLFIFFILLVLGYILWGGLKTIRITNKAQLDIGFICFNLFFIFILYKNILNGYIYNGIILFLISLFSIILLNILYPKLKNLFPNNYKNNYSLGLSVSLVIYLVGGIILLITARSIIPNDNLSIFIESQKIRNIFSLGILPMVSLLFANGLWQIVDISTWQRLAALNEGHLTKIEISRLLDFSGLYSSITWIIAIFFGMSLKYVGLNIPDAWTALQGFTQLSFNSGNFVDIFFTSTLFFSMLLIMFSTLDSIISSITFTVYYDFVSKGNRSVLGARIWTIIYTSLFGFIYYIIRQKVSTIDSILYTFYSFQLSLFPTIISMFLNMKVSKYSIAISIIAGFIGTLIPLLINSETINPYSSSALFSVFFSTLFLILSNEFLKFFVKNK
ncbi:MAG: hypothetical protein K1X55_17180 [Chitinophagales bacterium]|nr:hypothetical protein [Chitinophagales bacterium]